MARPREFDVDTALERAMNTFWSKGFKATSLDQLCAATGLGRSSLYAAFGSKRSLYFSALERYERLAAGWITAELGAPLPMREAVARFLRKIIDDIVTGRDRRGCLIGNCAAELSRQDRKVAGRVRRSMELMESTFRGELARAQERGEIAAHADVGALARFLMSSIHGLRLVGKANPDRAMLEDIVAVMLRCLER